MKKFLAILVLGLLICNVAVTKSSLPECEGNDPLIKIYTNDHYTMMRKWTNCHGTTIGPDGQQKYVGEFFMGNFHGQGTLTFTDGNTYVGEFKKGNFHGQGTMTLSEGTYVGEWKDMEHHGYGVLSFSDGSKYAGEWKDGKYHGQGTFTSSDGSKYTGEWKDGKQNRIPDSDIKMTINMLWEKSHLNK